MSLTGQLIGKNSSIISHSHCRNDSEELDVFEAARYFSMANETPSAYTKFAAQNFIREEKQINFQRPGGRMSLDIPLRNNFNSINPPQIDQKKQVLKEQIKKCKQPSSPGGKLASFLNSLFNQTSSKKKKSKSVISTSKDFEEAESTFGRRKRRSSISHFITNAYNDSSSSSNSSSKYNNLYSSSRSTTNSGFRTPPPYNPNTPTKLLMSFPDKYKQKLNRNDGNHHLKPKNDETLSGVSEKNLKNGSFGFSDRNSSSTTINWGGDDHELIRKFRSADYDDGAESDSSSDLFDLPNHDLDFYPSGLPVYETTHMDRIKINAAAPISSTAAA